MLKRTVVLIAVVLAMAALLPASSTLASPPLTRINHMTFSSPVRLPGNTLLTPGKYTFEAGPQGVSPDVVRVSTRDGRRVLYTGFTTLVTRPANGAMLTFGEAPANAPQPIAVWYESGARLGHRFRY
jgi:hypothetical protein